MKKIILSISLALPVFAMAENLKVETSNQEISVVHIEAEKVSSVSVKLSRVITRDDCNRRSITVELTPVSGNKDIAWFQTAYLSASTYMTEMGCPLKEPITETIYSKPIVLNSLKNQHADGLVDVRLIVSPEYKVEVTEIK